MPPFPLNLPVGSNYGREGQVAHPRLLNAYAEQQQTGKLPYAVYAAPGLARFDDGSYTGSARGLIELNSEALIAFLGNQIVSIDSAGTTSLLDTISGSGLLHLARNRASTPQIGVVTEAGQYYILSSGSLTLVTDSDLPAPNSICYLDGVFLFGIEDGRIFSSDLEDGTSIQADAFGTAYSDSSRLRTVFANAGFLFVFKEKGTEIWQADASLASENFYFSPVQQDIDIGCAAAHSVKAVAKSLAWVDDNGIVRHGSQGGAARISNHAVERDIASLSNTKRENLEAFSYVFHGHEIYCLSSDTWTWQYDFLIGRWNERVSYDAARWKATNCEKFNGLYIVGNVNDGSLYSIDPDTYTDGGSAPDQIVMEIWCAHSHRFPNRMIVDAIEIEAIAGQGLITGDDADVDPLLMIDYSDDGGATFEGQRTATMGRIGERRQKIRLNGWGLVSEKGRIWRLSASASTLRGIIQASLHGRPVA